MNKRPNHIHDVCSTKKMASFSYVPQLNIHLVFTTLFRVLILNSSQLFIPCWYVLIILGVLCGGVGLLWAVFIVWISGLWLLGDVAVSRCSGLRTCCVSVGFSVVGGISFSICCGLIVGLCWVDHVIRDDIIGIWVHIGRCNRRLICIWWLLISILVLWLPRFSANHGVKQVNIPFGSSNSNSQNLWQTNNGLTWVSRQQQPQ